MRLSIRNGLIVDGLGNPPFRGDLLAEDGRIRELRRGPEGPAAADKALAGEIIDAAGAETAEAAETCGTISETVNGGETTIDAAGALVCPGFVDLHRHCDTAALGEDFGLIELSQGICSCFAGNCGMAPVPNDPATRQALQNYLAPCLGSFEGESFHSHAEYLARLQAAHLPLNMGFYAGMGALRIAAKGFDAGPYSAGEMDRARRALGEALDCGAFGMSIGLMYVPEIYSSAAEIAALASVMKGGRGVLCTHMRWETERLPQAVGEVIAIAKQAEVPLEISHFKAAGPRAWHGALRAAIDIIETERARGADISVDFYPYDCGSSTMMQMLPPSLLAGGTGRALAGLSKPENVEKLRKLLAEGEQNWDNLSQTIGWDRTIISSVSLEENRKFLGKSVTDCTRDSGCRDEAEFVAALMHSEEGKVAIINRSMSVEDIDAIARLPYSSLISDALYGDMKNPHPRLYGAFPRFLREFVWQRRVLSLPAAIQKMTSQPARRVGLAGRGALQPGSRADILIFRPDQFRDQADYLSPARLAAGLDYAIINGAAAFRRDSILSRHAEVLRRNA